MNRIIANLSSVMNIQQMEKEQTQQQRHAVQHVSIIYVYIIYTSMDDWAMVYFVVCDFSTAIVDYAKLASDVENVVASSILSFVPAYMRHRNS